MYLIYKLTAFSLFYTILYYLSLKQNLKYSMYWILNIVKSIINKVKIFAPISP